MAVRVTFRETLTPVLGRMKDIVRKPYDKGRGALVRKAAVRVFEQQFARGGYFGASGSLIPWQPTQPFGAKPATVPPLGGADSSLLQAAKGGAGGAWSITSKRVSLAISLIYWPVHDKGARIPVTPRSRAFVRGKFGVNFRADKTHVVIPQRRLVDVRSPRFSRAQSEVFEEAFEEAIG